MTQINDEEGLAPIVDALRADRLGEYESLVSAFVKVTSEEALWSALGEAHGSAFNVFERLSAWPADGFRVAMRRLMPAVGHVRSLSATEGTQFLQFAERVPPSFRYSVSELLRPLLARAPDIAQKLGDALRRGDALGEGSTRVWAGAFASGAPLQAAQYAVSLYTGTAADVALMAVLLQFLPAANEEVRAMLQPLEAELANAITGAAPTLNYDAWHALTAIAGLSPTAMNFLQRAVEAGEPTGLAAVASWLHGVSTPTVGATAVPIERLVKDMLRHATQNPDVRTGVDSAVAGLLYRASLRPLMLLCVGALSSVDEDLEELFPDTFNNICEKPDDFTKLLTEWLLAEGVAFAAVRSLLARCSQQRAHVALDPVVFGGAKPARKVVAVRRLLALTHNGPVLCQFIACLAETPTLQPDGLNIAAQMLNEAFAEYPAATEEFLKSRTTTSDRQAPFAPVYRGMYANVLRWRMVLRRLPRLNELRPTDAQLQALRAVRQRVNRDIMRGAAEKSVFASIFTNVHLAQGRRFATHTAHGAPQIAEMQQASHSIELPSSELADPVGGMLRRAKTLFASR